mgnify:CR=1 FL=1
MCLSLQSLLFFFVTRFIFPLSLHEGRGQCGVFDRLFSTPPLFVQQVCVRLFALMLSLTVHTGTFPGQQKRWWQYKYVQALEECSPWHLPREQNPQEYVWTLLPLEEKGLLPRWHRPLPAQDGWWVRFECKKASNGIQRVLVVWFISRDNISAAILRVHCQRPLLRWPLR